MTEKTQTPFTQQLAYINRGMLDEELTEALTEVVKQVRETKKKGSVTLTLDVSMLNKRDENAVKITPKVKTSIPELPQAETIMWSTHDGDLLRDDPIQQKLDLQIVLKETNKNAPIQVAQAR